MHTVYVLKDKLGNLYKGFTSDTERRIKEHKYGKTKTTRKMENLQIIYTENLNSRLEARKREKYLKSAAGRRFLKSIGIWDRSSIG